MRRRDFLRTAGVAAAAPHLIGASRAMAAPSGPPRLEITWLGGATLAIRFNDATILTDPAFGAGEQAFEMGDPNAMFDLETGPPIIFHRRLTPFAGPPAAPDLLILSHLHTDHFDQTAEAALRKDIPAIAPPADLDTLRGKGFTAVRSLDWSETVSRRFGEGELTVTALPAEHSRDPEIAKFLGRGNGYWLAFRQGDWRRRIYWSGDTFPTEPVMRALADLDAPNLFIPHLGGVGATGPLGKISMGAEDALIMAEAMAPARMLPVHHSSYPLYLEPVWRLSQQAHGRYFGVDLIAEGATLDLS